MSYLKLCQLSNDNYVQDCDGEIIIDNDILYPITLSCEVINWVDEDEFLKRGQIISFQAVDVTIENESLLSIRQMVFNQLVVDYPLLNI